jgi:hypothetical protein
VGGILSFVSVPHSLLRCEIVEWIDRDWPGSMRARIVDAAGRVWYFEDKAPIFFADDQPLDAVSPFAGYIRCDVIRRVNADPALPPRR